MPDPGITGEAPPVNRVIDGTIELEGKEAPLPVAIPLAGRVLVLRVA